MYNRYQGNTGRMQRVSEVRDCQAPQTQGKQQAAQSSYVGSRHDSAFKQPSFLGSALNDFIPKLLGELETEDYILLLILYLMYRESGDTELLIIMGAMFLL